MKSLVEVGRVVRVSDQRVARSEGALAEQQTRLRPVEQQLQAIDLQHQALQAFLEREQPAAQTFSQAQLWQVLQQHAVVRRKLALLEAEKSQLKDDQSQIERGLQGLQTTHRELLRKQQKLKRLRDRLAVNSRLKRLRQEDDEADERGTGRPVGNDHAKGN